MKGQILPVHVLQTNCKVCYTFIFLDDSSTDGVRIKQEMPDYDDSFDQEQSPGPSSEQSAFPSAKVSPNSHQVRPNLNVDKGEKTSHVLFNYNKSITLALNVLNGIYNVT